MFNLSSGLLSTVTGKSGRSGWSPDGPAGPSSLVNNPTGLTLGPPSGSMPYDVYWTEAGNGVVRKFNGVTVSTVAGTARGFGSSNGPALSASFGSGGPRGLAFYGNDLFIADFGESRLFSFAVWPLL